jgi:hypothetical protein
MTTIVTLHEGAAATPVLRGAKNLIAGETYLLEVRPVKVGRVVVLYPAVCDFAPSGRLRVKVTKAKRGKRAR